MTNKEIRVRRIRGYFLKATQDIIKEKGIDGVTIRGVAKLAGYNSATLYNYFQNLNHLIALALSPHIGHYIEIILAGLPKEADAFKLYQLNWHTFASISFDYPKEYYYLFFANPDMDLSKVYEEYFHAHPKAYEKLPAPFQDMCRARTQYSRDEAFLKKAFPRLDKKTLERISRMNILIHKAMLFDMAKGTQEVDKKEYFADFAQYFQHISGELKDLD